MDDKLKDQSTTEQINQQDEGKKHKKLILLLLLLLLFSSVGVSLMLNHHTEELPVIDTITIDPVEKRNIHVSGQVMYSDGRVYQNGRVQLHSDVMETKTDENGWFLFKDVDPAEHTLSVLDKDGNVIAKALISVEQKQKGQNFNITKNKDGEYVVHLSTAIRYLELKVEVDGDKLLLIPESSYAVTDKGNVFTQDGQLKVDDGQIVLPSGTVVLENNNIVHYPYMVKPDNTIISIPEDGVKLEDGTVIQEDGTIVFPKDDVEINDERDEVTNGNDGTTHEIPKDKPSNVKPDGDVEPIVPSEPDTPTDPDKSVDPDKPVNPDTPVDPDKPTGPDTPIDTDKPVDPDTPVDPDKPTDPDKPVDPDKPTDPDTPVDPDKPTDPDTPVDPDDPLSPPEGYTVRGNNKAGWTSPWNVTTPLTALDLFDTGKINSESVPVIQPGSEGSYIFCLENNRSTNLSVKIYLEKVSKVEFPLEYRLSEIQSIDSVVDDDVKWQSLKDGELTLSADGTIGHKSTDNRKLYRLEWRWPFDKTNSKDTELGKNQSKFEIKLGVRVEELVKEK